MDMRTIFLLVFFVSACRSSGKINIGDQVAQENVSESYPDNDLDGYSEDDCDDGDASINPSMTEICDGVDNNCDGSVDEGVSITIYADADGDGYGDTNSTVDACGTQQGYVSNGIDCNDDSASVFPGHPEICDGVDNDCDGDVDDADPDLDRSGATSFYADVDGDGYGDVTSEVLACAEGDGQVSNADDCDDGNVLVNPQADEICDEIDNDCDSFIDEDDDSLIDIEACTCHSLDFAGGYVQVNSTADIPAGNDARSVSVWFYTDVASYSNLISWGDGSQPNRRFSVHLRSEPGAQNLRFCGQFNDHFSRTVPLQTWIHVVMTHDGSTLKMYVDGALTDTTNTTLDTAPNTPVFLGRNALNRNDEYFYGNIAGASIWNRALDASEVTDLYNSNTMPTNGLVVDWYFSGIGMQLPDSTGNGQEGELMGNQMSWTEDCP